MLIIEEEANVGVPANIDSLEIILVGGDANKGGVKGSVVRT
jgi:hypothetical protein